MLTFAIPCLFGLEGLVGDELRRLGLQEVQVENGRVLCKGTFTDLARLNINLRCGERVHILMGAFPARSFEALFQGVSAIAWEEFIPVNGQFPVKGHALDSMLHSIPDCQKIVKKAVVNRLARATGHLEKVKRMVEDDADCSEVLIQIAAVRNAINNTGKLILKNHLEHCIVHAIEENDLEEIQAFNKAIDTFVK